jgi:lysophospholipase L1-like esterase
MQKNFIGATVMGLVAIATTWGCSAPNEAPVAETRSAETTASTSYLALGDSIAFGEDGYISWTDPSRQDPSKFVGYPFTVAQNLYGSASQVYDIACPGETTGSFSSSTAPDNGCREYRFTDGNPLHEPYTGTQMQAALAYLAQNPQTKLITITLGANDLLLAEYACDDASSVLACEVEALPGIVAAAAENMASILDGIRGTGYAGEIIYLSAYATSYTDLAQVTAIPTLNTALGAVVVAHGGRVASGFDTFAVGSVLSEGDPCAAGLLIPNPDGSATCDKHPSPKGRNLLAGAVDLVH